MKYLIFVRKISYKRAIFFLFVNVITFNIPFLWTCQLIILPSFYAVFIMLPSLSSHVHHSAIYFTPCPKTPCSPCSHLCHTLFIILPSFFHAMFAMLLSLSSRVLHVAILFTPCPKTKEFTKVQIMRLPSALIEK